MQIKDEHPAIFVLKYRRSRIVWRSSICRAGSGGTARCVIDVRRLSQSYQPRPVRRHCKVDNASRISREAIQPISIEIPAEYPPVQAA